MILKIENLHKSYKNVKAVDGVSFHIRKGEIFGLLGPNGAGKTTVIKMISTLTRPDSGSIEVNGCDVIGDRRGVRQSVAVVPQENNLEVSSPFMITCVFMPLCAGFPVPGAQLRMLWSVSV